jgi:tetratricopeptide (TPR) repeat protein
MRAVMEDEEDIAAALPRPPLPAPARREAAIAEALRRFDGSEAAAPPPGKRTSAAEWLPAHRRPWAGALAGAFLVALVGLPFVWSSFDDYAVGEKRGSPPAVEAPAAQPPAASADLASPPLSDAAVASGSAAERSADSRSLADPNPTAAVKAEPPPPPPDSEALADSAADSSGEIMVTGSRIRNPNLTSSSPVTVVGGEEIALTGTRARRGDWNACTIDDPKRDLTACRRAVNPAARGASGRAAAHVADGLASAWDGEPEDAIAAFDRAIEIAPGSATAYLNRGLAWQRMGNLDRALADLERAVRIDSRSARIYYHRSRVLRARGNERRAQADEERAVALDPTYEPLVRAQRRQRR